jgi:hypothetical protein
MGAIILGVISVMVASMAWSIKNAAKIDDDDASF